MKTYTAKSRHRKPCVFCETAIKVGDVVVEWTWTNEDWKKGDPQHGKMGGVSRAHKTCEGLATAHELNVETIKTFAEADEERRENESDPLFVDKAAHLLRTLRAGLNPWVVCIAGSTRFIELIAALQWHFEMQGSITFAPLYLPPAVAPGPHHAEKCGVKESIDELFKRKIDLADEVVVFDLERYVGESTRSEIEYAERIGRPVRYYSQDAGLQKALEDVTLRGPR